MISPLDGCNEFKTWISIEAFYGIEPCIVDKEGKELEGECEGMLCMKRSWPGQMRLFAEIAKDLLILIFLNLMQIFYRGWV